MASKFWTPSISRFCRDGISAAYVITVNLIYAEDGVPFRYVVNSYICGDGLRTTDVITVNLIPAQDDLTFRYVIIVNIG